MGGRAGCDTCDERGGKNEPVAAAPPDTEDEQKKKKKKNIADAKRREEEAIAQAEAELEELGMDAKKSKTATHSKDHIHAKKIKQLTVSTEVKGMPRLHSSIRTFGVALGADIWIVI